MSIFGLYPGSKLSFENSSVCKNFFLTANLKWDARLSSREEDQKFKTGGCIGYGDSTWNLYLVTPKYLDYMHFYMMLLDIVVKALVTVA